MRKMLLTSTGLNPELAKEFLTLVGTKPAETKVGFIWNANDPYATSETEGYVLKEKSAFESLGFTDHRDVDLRVAEDLAKLDECGVICVGGGNTYYLLKLVRESKFDVKLKELLSNDKVYMGISAGSIIVGTSIETAGVGPSADSNDAKLEDLRGLRQVPFMVAVHMEQKQKIYYDQFARTRQLRPIIGISDEQAIVCEGDRYRVVGPGKPMTWSSKLFR
ncbi:MAG: Type 1 glutamine amidotransferase-like domain-containing protein [Patescibacteria group bacterium]